MLDTPCNATVNKKLIKQVEVDPFKNDARYRALVETTPSLYKVNWRRKEERRGEKRRRRVAKKEASSSRKRSWRGRKRKQRTNRRKRRRRRRGRKTEK